MLEEICQCWALQAPRFLLFPIFSFCFLMVVQEVKPSASAAATISAPECRVPAMMDFGALSQMDLSFTSCVGHSVSSQRQKSNEDTWYCVSGSHHSWLQESRGQALEGIGCIMRIVRSREQRMGVYKVVLSSRLHSHTAHLGNGATHSGWVFPPQLP